MHQPIFPTQAEDFLVATLGLWRMTHLLAVEEGPFRLIVRLRARAGESFVGELFDCFYCLSVWLAIPLALLLAEGWTQRLLLWLALSGAACLLEQGTKRIDLPGVFEEQGVTYVLQQTTADNFDRDATGDPVRHRTSRSDCIVATPGARSALTPRANL